MDRPQVFHSTLHSKISSHNNHLKCYHTAKLSKILCKDAPLTVQQVVHNVL